MNTRDALIDATRTLLSTKGYEATSPRDIQRASGVGQGSFYHHFEGKLDLASEALTALSTDMSAEFDALTATDEPVGAYLNAPRDPLAGCRIGRMTMEASVAEEQIRKPIASYFEHVKERLAAAFGDMDLPVRPEAMASLAIAAVQGGFVIARATADPAAQAEATSALEQLIEVLATPSAGSPS